ncbi:MAG: tyrosine-type recombinase/integrase, partial [Brachybacterium tyrofermentans]
YEHRCSDDPEKPTCGKKRGAACHSRQFRVPDGYEYVQMAGRWHWIRPKTRAGKRLIPLVPWMVEALRQWRLVAPKSALGLVWPAPDGGVREKEADRLEFHTLQKAAGVSHPGGRFYHVHEARHATASILLAMRVDTQVIIAIMGHSS